MNTPCASEKLCPGPKPNPHCDSLYSHLFPKLKFTHEAPHSPARQGTDTLECPCYAQSIPVYYYVRLVLTVFITPHFTHKAYINYQNSIICTLNLNKWKFHSFCVHFVLPSSINDIFIYQ